MTISYKRTVLDRQMQIKQGNCANQATTESPCPEFTTDIVTLSV
jgi:hypothetical protein